MGMMLLGLGILEAMSLTTCTTCSLYTFFTASSYVMAKSTDNLVWSITYA